MHPDTITQFFFWCSVINTGLLLLGFLVYVVAPGPIWRNQRGLFPMGEREFRVVFYCAIVVFKLMVIVFNWVPYFALRLMT